MWKFYSTLNTIFPLPSWLFKTIPRRIKFTTKLSNYNTFNIKKKKCLRDKIFSQSSKSFFLPSSQTIRSLLAESRRVNGGFWGGEKKKKEKREGEALFNIH